MTTHINKLKTNDRMLPQSYPLKSLVISPIGDKQEKVAGYMHCQGEGEAQLSPIPIQFKSCIETSPVMDSNTISSGVLKVFVTSKTSSPLMPCHPARARMLLRKKKAVVTRHLPFVLKLKHRASGQTQKVSLNDAGTYITKN